MPSVVIHGGCQIEREPLEILHRSAGRGSNKTGPQMRRHNLADTARSCADYSPSRWHLWEAWASEIALADTSKQEIAVMRLHNQRNGYPVGSNLRQSSCRIVAR